ncbi:MAG: hypothetical protein COY50_11855, partial [Deltaproteobacteria bacterium CG_4_10_14_0_8_um_filter_43_12]
MPPFYCEDIPQFFPFNHKKHKIFDISPPLRYFLFQKYLYSVHPETPPPLEGGGICLQLNEITHLFHPHP